MTTTATPTTVLEPAPTIAQRSRSVVGGAAHYTLSIAVLTARNFSFVLFSVAMPVLLYLVFNSLYGSADFGGGINWSAVIMVNMAAYGSLGAAMSGGAQLALERRSGWLRQLAITSLPPRAFMWSRAAVIMLMVLPALILVFAAGATTGGVRAPLGQWLAALVLMWVGLIPLTVAGIVIGVWVKGEAVQGVTTMTLLLLSLAGGLWFPVQAMPALMQHLAHGLPSYWLAELGRWPFLPDAAFPWTGVAVLAAWSAGLTVLGALGYRRAAALSKR